MSILNWFRKAAKGEDAGAAAPPAGETADAEIAGLNFMTAIDAHMKWKARLEAYIMGTGDEDLQPEVVCADDKCVLGKWIYGPGGERFGGSEAFADMKTQHAEFHLRACKVLETTRAGDKEAALRMLQHGDYVRASERVKMQLAKLYVQIAE